jgi:hypothetical protein
MDVTTTAENVGRFHGAVGSRRIWRVPRGRSVHVHLFCPALSNKEMRVRIE